jgi:catechol 2,3-dioxygenase-like lactoylglutathione lyase family enzyme
VQNFRQDLPDGVIGGYDAVSMSSIGSEKGLHPCAQLVLPCRTSLLISGLIGTSDISGSVKITRAVPNIRSNRPAETRDFFVDLLGFEVAMDMGSITTVASPTNPSAQVTIVGNDDMAAPGISVEVADVDAVHAKAREQGFEIAYPLRDEEWGVRRFMLREPSGTIVNVLSHRSG